MKRARILSSRTYIQQYTSSEAIELAVQLSVCLYNSGFYWVYFRMLARCKLPYSASSLTSFRSICNRCITNTDYCGQDRVKYNRKKTAAMNKQTDVFVKEKGIQNKKVHSKREAKIMYYLYIWLLFIYLI